MAAPRGTEERGQLSIQRYANQSGAARDWLGHGRIALKLLQSGAAKVGMYRPRFPGQLGCVNCSNCHQAAGFSASKRVA